VAHTCKRIEQGERPNAVARSLQVSRRTVDRALDRVRLLYALRCRGRRYDGHTRDWGSLRVATGTHDGHNAWGRLHGLS